MFKRIARLLFMLFMSGAYLSVAQPADFPGSLPVRTYALIIGISDYSHLQPFQSIPYADSDAEKFADFLVKSGNVLSDDDVVLLTNEQATLEETMTQLYTLKAKVSRQKSRVIIFFTGHSYIEGNGLSAGNISFLLSDTPADFIWNRSLRWKDLQGVVASLIVAHQADVFLFLDSAHADEREMMGTIGRQLDSPFLNELKVLSTLPGQLSLELPQMEGGHRLFAYYLLRGMEGEADRNLGNGDGKVEAGELEAFLTDNLGKHSRGNQYPLVVGDPRKIVATYTSDPFTQEQIDSIKKESKTIIKKTGSLVVSASNDPCAAYSRLIDPVEIPGLFRDAVGGRNYFTPDCNNAFYYYRNSPPGLDKEEMRARLIHAVNHDAGDLLKQYQSDLLNSVPVSEIDTMIGRLSFAQDLSYEMEVGYNSLLSRKFFLSGISEIRKTRKGTGSALEKFEQAVQLDPYSSCAYHAAAVLYRRQGQEEKADQYIYMANNLSPLWEIPEDSLMVMSPENSDLQPVSTAAYPYASPFALPGEKTSPESAEMIRPGDDPDLASQVLPGLASGQGYPDISRRSADAEHYGFQWLDPSFHKGYTIQAGTFKDYDRSLTEMQRLKSLTDQPCMMQMEGPEQATVFRLLTGLFEHSYQAEGLQAYLREKGFETTIVSIAGLSR